MLLAPNRSDNIFMELSLSNLKKFHQKAIKELTDLRLFFNMHTEEQERILLQWVKGRGSRKKFAKAVVFEELCYTCKCTISEVEKYLDILKQRIRSIEECIDHHFQLIVPVLYKDAKDKMKRQQRKDREDRLNAEKMRKKAESAVGGAETIRTTENNNNAQQKLNESQQEQELIEKEMQKQEAKRIIEEALRSKPELQFDKYTYERKLTVLDYYEEKLFLADREQAINRQSIKTICRMQESICQSYFFLDHQGFEEAHKIYNVPFKDLRAHLGLEDHQRSQDSSEEAEEKSEDEINDSTKSYVY